MRPTKVVVASLADYLEPSGACPDHFQILNQEETTWKHLDPRGNRNKLLLGFYQVYWCLLFMFHVKLTVVSCMIKLKLLAQKLQLWEYVSASWLDTSPLAPHIDLSGRMLQISVIVLSNAAHWRACYIRCRKDELMPSQVQDGSLVLAMSQVSSSAQSRHLYAQGWCGCAYCFPTRSKSTAENEQDSLWGNVGWWSLSTVHSNGDSWCWLKTEKQRPRRSKVWWGWCPHKPAVCHDNAMLSAWSHHSCGLLICESKSRITYNTQIKNKIKEILKMFWFGRPKTHTHTKPITLDTLHT